MAFGKGSVVSENSFNYFIGYDNFKIHGVNMSKEELSALYGRTVEKDRVFTREIDINGVKTPAVNLEFTVSTVIEGAERFFNLRYSITRAAVTNAEGTKVKVIDEYGRTAWASNEEAKNHVIPTYSNGPANITANYRPLYRGEEQLTMMLKSYLGIPSVEVWGEVDGKKKVVGMIENPKLAEARLAKIEDYFKGDVSELKELLTYQPENKIGLLMGVQTDDQNRKWQTFFIEFPMRANSGTQAVQKLAVELKARKDAGAYANVEFEICPLKKYEEKPSNFATPASNPFIPNAPEAAPASNPWFQQ